MSHLRVFALAPALTLLAALLGPAPAVATDYVDHLPARTITGDASGLYDAYGVAVDAAGNTYTANSTDTGAGWVDTIVVHGPGASGDAAPERTIVVDSTGGSAPSDVFVDGAGYVYVASFFSPPTIRVYAPGADGNASPVRTISGDATQLDGETGIAVDATGAIYATQAYGGTIQVFAPDADGNVAPTRTISWDQTRLTRASGLALANGLAWVAFPHEGTVAAFSASADGTVAPVRELVGPATTLAGPVAVDVDSGGRLYVADSSDMAVDVFAPGATGDVAPLAALTGPNTGITELQGVAVDASKNITVSANRRMLAFYNPIVTDPPPVQVTRPGAVQRLHVTGRPGARTRTVKWQAPASDGHSAITGYRVVVKKGTRVLITRNVGPAARSVTVRKSRLRDGWNKVVVQARNSAGMGRSSSKRFLVVK